jgi:tRNA nucleotidyltransferase/poly(A) polymerase
MKIMKVGGAVRDTLMGRTPKDIDYVVVGATPHDMISRGFVQVGADFPVFLHPETKEEYALARKERKVTAGYHGFETDFSTSVTLEEDLGRRDITANSIAQDIETGEIIDPFNGQEDLKNKILRHTSSAFAEDPVRVLRVARFTARYVDFKVAEKTIELMKDLVSKGELQHLTKERVVLEFEKAFSENDPMRFITCLWQVGALEVIFPELDVMIKDQSPARLIEWTITLRHMTCNIERIAFMFSKFEEEQIKSICERMKFSNEVRDLSIDFKIFRQKYDLNARYTVKVFDHFKVSHNPQQFWKVFNMFNSINMDNRKDSHRASLMISDYCSVSFDSLTPEQKALKGSAISEAIMAHRMVKIDNYF